MEATAYVRWLAKASNRDRERIAIQIQCDAMEQGWIAEMAFELLEETGDKEYTNTTFLKASDIVLDATKHL